MTEDTVWAFISYVVLPGLSGSSSQVLFWCKYGVQFTPIFNVPVFQGPCENKQKHAKTISVTLNRENQSCLNKLDRDINE